MRRPTEPGVCHVALCAGHLRRLSVMLQDTGETDITKVFLGRAVVGQRLEAEVAYTYLPDFLKSQSSAFLAFE